MDDYAYSDNPAVFWDLYGEQGHPIRTTVSEMGPLLLSRLLDLNDTQEGVLQIIFRHADDNGLLILDFEDLQSVLAWASENAQELSGKYGNVSKRSVGAIQRQLLSFESQGADMFFGEPALEIDDFLSLDDEGRGIINTRLVLLNFAEKIRNRLSNGRLGFSILAPFVETQREQNTDRN